MKLQRNSFRNYSVEQKIFISRTLLSFIVIFVLSSILIINFYYLQILQYNHYNSKSNENRIRVVSIAPNRGIIFDRNGVPLALNHTVYQAELVLKKKNTFKQTLIDLRPILDLTDNDIEVFKKKYKSSHIITSVPIKKNLNNTQIARFAVNQHRFPEVEIKSYQYRYYPYKKSMSHIVGYVSKINNRDVIRLSQEGKWPNYICTQAIGKIGIESYYEDILHGKSGYEEIEVNNRGHVIRHLYKQAAKSGRDIYLTIDFKLQKYIEQLLTKNSAAVVVSDPRNGEILALVSTPGYDPNLFVEGISKKTYQALLNNKNHPFYNRVLQAAYPPASTVKPYIAVSALNAGIINSNTTLFDPGWWQLPGSVKRYRDWKKWGHGRVNLKKSLEESVDTFFYQLAYDIGIDRLSKWMNKFGYGQRTGIDLPQESTGNMPTRAWKMKRFKQPWYQGDTISVGIGQGYWTATPIQMNNAMMILINNGATKVPHVLRATRKKKL